MSRQRFIHPEIFESQDFLALSHGARLLFIGLFALADDHGRGRGGEMHLSGSVFPGESVPIRDWIGEVSARKLARFYEVAGSVYYDLPTWSKWQKPKYVADSKVPSFHAGAPIPTSSGPNPGQSGPESGPNPDTGSNRVVIGRGCNGDGLEQTCAPTARPARSRSLRKCDDIPGFDAFWTQYPKRKDRAKAERAWRKLSPDDALQAVILAAIARQRCWPAWTKDGGEFIPHGATWINNRRWLDEEPTSLQPQFSQKVERSMRAIDEWKRSVK